MKAILADEKFLRLVNPIAQKTLKKCEAVLKPNESYAVSITPTSDPFIIKKMNGASGFTSNRQKMSIEISTKAKNWKKWLSNVLVHEFNHIVRMQRLNIRGYYGGTLSGSIAMEGLAMVFEEEITGNLPPYAHAVSKKKASLLWAKIRKYKKADYYRRFFTNAGDPKYPLWCGYTIAYLIVKKRKKELGVPWKKLIGMPTEELVRSGL
ncbi:MAG: hypothetical protein KGH71_05385 [Candidatus Micrarchaeota archaeon]|nr:hypothetical protein [Candidatus Micrarchaeota archaeon]